MSVRILLLFASLSFVAAQQPQKPASPPVTPAQKPGQPPAASPGQKPAGEQPKLEIKSDLPAKLAPLPREAQDDPVLRAMHAELSRSQQQLRLQQLARPYYIEYSVTDYEEYASDAGFGAIRNEQRHRARVVRVVARIGDYKQDSFFGPGEGVVELLPIENSELALRHHLWLATDNAYKAALEALTAKQSVLKNVVVEHAVEDFSREEPTQSIGPLVSVNVDPEFWRPLLREASSMHRRDPHIQNSDAIVQLRAINRWFLNTEGTVTRRGTATHNFYFSGAAQAPDGMRVERSDGYSVARPEDMPKPEQIRKDVDRLTGTLISLRSAPLFEDAYNGPVLFAPDAAADIINRLVAPNILGKRPEIGSPARTSGAYAAHYKSRILPTFVSVVDDPTQKEFKGKSLVGHYQVDDEGVKAQRVTIVDDGVLVNYLTSRTPIRDFTRSNGHGRTVPGGAPTPAISNLFIQAEETASPGDLLKRMLEMCKEQSKPYGYLIETTGPDLAPRLIYRVYVQDGRRELVRGAEFDRFDTRTLRSDLIGVGDDPVSQDRGEPIPRSIISPSLLFGEVDMKRATRTREKLPEYPPPDLKPQQRAAEQPSAQGGKPQGNPAKRADAPKQQPAAAKPAPKKR